MDLPAYIKRCSLNDPELNESIVRNANLAIPMIVHGDANLSVPSVYPLSYQEAPAHGRDLEIFLSNTCNYSLKDLKATNCVFDLKNQIFKMTFIHNRLNTQAETYKFISGKLIDIPVSNISGEGRFYATLDDLIIYFEAALITYEKDGKTYIDIQNSSVNVQMSNCHWVFENIQSSEHGDVNAYINANSAKFWDQVHHSFEFYLNKTINRVLNPIITKVPLDKIFLT